VVLDLAFIMVAYVHPRMVPRHGIFPIASNVRSGDEPDRTAPGYSCRNDDS
jgi:hypothetical protein